MQTKVHDMTVWMKKSSADRRIIKIMSEVKVENPIKKKEKRKRIDFKVDISVVLHNFLSCIFRKLDIMAPRDKYYLTKTFNTLQCRSY